MSPDAPQPYGAITLAAAKKAAAPALAEASRNNWAMAVAVVDSAGDLVYFERMDATQSGSVVVAIDKARSAARFKRPTKAFQDMLAAGGEGWRVLGLEGAVPSKGASRLSSTARSSARSASQGAQARKMGSAPGPAWKRWCELRTSHARARIDCQSGRGTPRLSNYEIPFILDTAFPYQNVTAAPNFNNRPARICVGVRHSGP